jgi:excisionase family DNA binding protein
MELWDGIAVPGALCAELALALEEYRSLLPPARRNGRLPLAVAGIQKASRSAATHYAARQHAARAWAAPTPAAAEVLGSAQLASVSVVEEITTAQAADLAGLTPEWWRRLAVRGTIRARQVDRRTWLLSRTDVIAYATDRPMETSADDNRDQDAPGPQRQAC